MRAALLRRVAVTIIAMGVLVLAQSPVSAQYFGRNKVQYRSLQFQVLKTAHFDIYFYPAERDGVDVAARMAERWYARLERLFAHTLNGRQALILYASHADFEQTNIIGGELSEGTGGVTEGLRRRIILPLGGPLADTDHVIGHELVHAFQFDMTTRPESRPGQSDAALLPLWFIEGMAEYLTLGPLDAHTAMWLRDAARPVDGKDALPAIKDLDDSKYFPYRWGHAFWAYVGGRFGDGVIRRMLGAAGSAGRVSAAIERVLGVTEQDLSNDWQASIRDTYRTILTATPAASAARAIIKGQGLGTDLNVGPAISPDGKWIAFLSERGFFSIDLYLADASTGAIVRQLTSTATDSHFASIQFIYSAGTWDSASEHLAIAAVVDGTPALVVFDARTGNVDREVTIPAVDEVRNPAWSPDGRAIAFTGMTHGLTDLFVYDLTAATLRQITHDAFTDLQPAWSPDGTRIAFITDRFATRLPTLTLGDYRLAVVDPGNGVVAEVPAFTSGKHIDPHWSPDGRSLYFVANPDGISNLYRVATEGGAVAQLTAVPTGVSGITASSPAMSVAARTGTIALCVYERGAYTIYTLDDAAGALSPPAASMEAAVLPPVDRRPSEVAALLANPAFGVEPPQAFPTVPYSAKLSLEDVSEPAVAVGASRFGAQVGGGVSLTFGDLLENHRLVTALEVNSGLTGTFSANDIAGQVAYINQAHRWNWGVIGGQVPYLSGGYETGFGTAPGGGLVQIDRLIVYRQTERSGSALAAYKFDRARRLELQGGVSHLSFEQVVRTTTFSLASGERLTDTTATTELARSLNLGTSSAAYVFDTSTFGATSPVGGVRYRLEADPTFGTINYMGVLADYRRYMMPVPFYTLAARVMHYGRYGSGGEDPRLYPLYVGYPGLVRGYDSTGLDDSDCVATATSACALIDRQLGSRMLVGNIELRFPLLRPLGMSRQMYGPLPVEVALFADSGVAWNSGEKPAIFGGSRQGVTSAGVALRVNLMGLMVGEFDVLRAFQRPQQGWMFTFNFLPGW